MGSDTSPTSDQPSRRRDHCLVNNPTTTVPATAPTTHPRTSRDRDTSELNTASNTRSRDGHVSPSIGVLVLGVLNSSPPLQPPAVADEALGDGNTVGPHAPRVDRIPSINPYLKPSTHSAHNQPSLSTAPPSHAVTPSITKTASGWTSIARGTLPGDPKSVPQTAGAPSDLPHAPRELKGPADPNEQGQSTPSASPRRPPLAASAVDSPSQPQPVSGPRSLDRNNSHIRGSEGVEREAKRATEGSTSGNTERKRTITSQEPGSQQESPVADSYNAQRRKPESSFPSSFASHSQQYPKAAPEGSAESMHSYNLGHGPVSITSHLPSDGESRGGVGRPSDSLLSSNGQEVSLTPPPVSLSASTQSIPKHATGVLSKNNPTGSSADTNPRPPTEVGNSQIRVVSSFSRTMSSRVSAPIAPITSQDAQKKAETRPGPILPSKSSIGQPLPATGPLVPQKEVYTGSPRKASNDATSRLPDDCHYVETHVPSVKQVYSPQGAVENKPQAKLSDGVGLAQPSSASSFVFSNRLCHSYLLYYPIARTEPSMITVSPNTREARGSQAQPSHSISQQRPQPEQYRVDPLIARQTGIPSEPAAAVSGSSQYKFVPVVTYVPLPVSNSPSLPPYERSAPHGARVSQEGTPSSSSEACDVPNKSSGKWYPTFRSPLLSSHASLFYHS